MHACTTTVTILLLLQQFICTEVGEGEEEAELGPLLLQGNAHACTTTATIMQFHHTNQKSQLHKEGLTPNRSPKN